MKTYFYVHTVEHEKYVPKTAGCTDLTGIFVLHTNKILPKFHNSSHKLNSIVFQASIAV